MMSLESAQALELAHVVEMEASWENLRTNRVANRGKHAKDSLIAVQRSYEAHHSRLVAYNQRHRPAHVPEQLLNTPKRLRGWCLEMSDLFGIVKADSTAPCPLSLLEKAYRRAEGIASRVRQAPPARRIPPQTIQAAIEDLQAVAVWCASLERATSAECPSVS
jgi:hypothetical protein